ncbi:2-hydroxychromene-2-carboxylate isomerase [Paraburkholderia sp. UYCP14C]|uniref:2-hydroxychromene-2-carboxylate isomerase n=1 Tax=Paraburkholderia sp. UYCP14C TaxID=2511130 RepID=UPI00101EACD7|nr:2-hydroxychromene-2-carboxylate isomerase [Paraburkholderia sp. UYCP14C]RZF26735.1 2-hydroxychromene-2-carboxylate isomerase [Paraburkholderia sp. UYCP14C]
MQVRFVLDYRSIYSYLANSQVKKLGVTIDYELVDIVSVMKHVNNQPSPLCPPKLRYSRVDAGRWAQKYDLALSPNKTLLNAMKEGHLPNALLSRAGLAAQQMGLFEKVNETLFNTVWTGTEDLATDEARLQFAAANDIPAALWEVADSPEIVAQLAVNNERAIENGVFGVPTFFVDQDMFFGNDRLSFVKDKLDALARASQ